MLMICYVISLAPFEGCRLLICSAIDQSADFQGKSKQASLRNGDIETSQ